ncbi:MAG: hypothetical protein AABZ51_07000 [Nitrospirota bacterium]
MAYDVMAVPGRAINLVADLLKEGFLAPSPLGGEVLFFEHEGRMLGRTLTGGDGRAMVPFTPRAVGRVTVTVRVGESRRVTAQETTAGVFVWDRKRPIVIISMKALVSAPRRPDLGLPLPRSGAKPQNPDGGAVQALTVLAKRAHLIYVTASDRLELSEVRQWADRNRLPAGPVFPLKPVPMSLSHELERWRREGWTNIRGGLAGTADEAKALVERKLKAIVPPNASPQDKWPDQAVVVKGWEEVVRQFS